MRTYFQNELGWKLKFPLSIKSHFKFISHNPNMLSGTIHTSEQTFVLGESADRWREAYGSFCAGHNDAVSVFKDLMKSDRRFGQFVRQCSENPLLKKKGVPECILFVTTRWNLNCTVMASSLILPISSSSTLAMIWRYFRSLIFVNFFHLEPFRFKYCVFIGNFFFAELPNILFWSSRWSRLPKNDPQNKSSFVRRTH